MRSRSPQESPSTGSGPGNIRDDALDPDKRFASMPLFVRNQDGSQGLARRQCTSEYKLKPIKKKVRDLLGYPYPSRPPADVFAEQWVGFSTDERDRALDQAGELKSGDVRYSRNRYPLLELGMSRDKCLTLLEHHGFRETPKSACIGCPFHGNPMWRDLRDNRPEEWEDAVEFDEAIRGGSARANATGSQLRGESFLHRSMVPLSRAPIDRVSYREWAGRQGDFLSDIAVAEYEEELSLDEQPTGCSPFSCHGEPVLDDEEEVDGDGCNEQRKSA